MHHDPLTLHEIGLHTRRAHELRASYEADFPGKLVDAVRHKTANVVRNSRSVFDRTAAVTLHAKWRLAAAALAILALVLGGFITIASAHGPQNSADLCAKRETVVMKAIQERVGATDVNDILGRARITMQTAHRWCAEGRRTQADALYNYVLRRVNTLRTG